MALASSRLARKVPEITAIFWVAKILTTAMGEATSDFFVSRFNPYVAVILGGVVLVLALALQFSVRKYIPWVYWLAVTMVAVFGTMAADVLHIQFGIPYTVTTLFFAVVLVVVFTIWRKSEGTLSIHSINSPRREFFYWATVLATFALGTATGDWTATTLGLGYLSSGILFAVVILIPALGHRLFGMGEIFSFWFAYITTRPLGASFADWFSKPAPNGRDFGDGTVSLFLTVLIVLCVAYMTVNRQETHHEHLSR